MVDKIVLSGACTNQALAVRGLKAQWIAEARELKSSSHVYHDIHYRSTPWNERPAAERKQALAETLKLAQRIAKEHGVTLLSDAKALAARPERRTLDLGSQGRRGGNAKPAGKGKASKAGKAPKSQANASGKAKPTSKPTKQVAKPTSKAIEMPLKTPAKSGSTAKRAGASSGKPNASKAQKSAKTTSTSKAGKNTSAAPVKRAPKPKSKSQQSPAESSAKSANVNGNGSKPALAGLNAALENAKAKDRKFQEAVSPVKVQAHKETMRLPVPPPPAPKGKAK